MRPSRHFLVLFSFITICASVGQLVAGAEDAGARIDNAEPPANLTGLGGRLTITATAASWSALVERHPTLTVGSHDLIWVGKDEHGQIQFTLDEAYTYQPPGQPRQWVLLAENDAAPFDEFYREVMGGMLRGVAKLMSKAPEPDEHDIYGDYAVVKGSHPTFGTVYEIGWQMLMASGTCLCEENRRLYVLQDGVGQWHFLGEGPGAGTGKSGGNESSNDDIESKVVWTSVQPPNLPVEILLTVKGTSTEWAGEDDKFIPRPDLVGCEDYVLAAPYPAQLRSITSHPYVPAEPGDTLEKIARLNAAWESDWMKTSEKAFWVQTWREGLARLNPDLPRTGIIATGTRVQLLNPVERDAARHDYDENVDIKPVLSGDSWQGVIFSVEDAQFSPVLKERFKEFWQPTEADIAQLEKDFAIYLAAPENAATVNLLPGLRTAPKDYRRQYVGIIVNGERRILVNGLPRDLKNWGGDNAWRHGYLQAYDTQQADSWEVIYLPAQHQFVEFAAIPAKTKSN